MILKHNFNPALDKHLTMKKEIMHLNIRALEEKKNFFLLIQVKSSNCAHKKCIQNVVCLVVGSHLSQSYQNPKIS